MSTTAGYKRRWRNRIKLEQNILSDSDYDRECEINANHNPENSNHLDENFNQQEERYSSSPQQTSSSNDDNTDGNDESIGDSNTDEEVNNNSSLLCDLRDWACRNKCTRNQVNELLSILRSNGHPELPVDSRTLIQTPREIKTVEKCGGQYIYIGIKKNILNCLAQYDDFQEETIELRINIDGIPLYKSSGLQAWPILGAFHDSHPFLIAIFCGSKKPSNCDDFLQDFLQEYEDLKIQHLTFRGKQYKIKIHSVLCDAPARQFLKCVKGHSGYFSCERCEIEGERVEFRMVFLSTSESLRTDPVFDIFGYPNHQSRISPLIDAGIKCIKQFPLDYMHILCLGVVRVEC